MKKTIFWKLYYWPVATLLLISAAYALVNKELNLLMVIDLVMLFSALLGMFGFIYQKSIFSAKFWKNWSCALIAWELTYSLIYSQFFQSIDPVTLKKVGFVLFFYSFSIPLFLSVILYGYKSSHIWKS